MHHAHAATLGCLTISECELGAIILKGAAFMSGCTRILRHKVLYALPTAMREVQPKELQHMPSAAVHRAAFMGREQALDAGLAVHFASIAAAPLILASKCDAPLEGCGASTAVGSGQQARPGASTGSKRSRAGWHSHHEDTRPVVRLGPDRPPARSRLTMGRWGRRSGRVELARELRQPCSARSHGPALRQRTTGERGRRSRRAGRFDRSVDLTICAQIATPPRR